MSLSDALELAAGLMLLAGGIVLYRRRAREDSRYGSQGGVILIVFGLIAIVLGFDLLEYRPWPGEMMVRL